MWLIYVVLASLCWGAWGVLTKYISDDISPFVNHFLFTTGMLFTLPFVIGKCKLKEVSLKAILWGISAGILAITGNVSVYRCFSLGGQATVVIPFTSLYPLITLFIALLIFKEKLNFINGIGILMVVPAIVLLSGNTAILDSPKMFFKNLDLEVWMVFAFIATLLFGIFSASQKVISKYLSGWWSYLSFIVSSVIVSVCFIAFGLVDFNFSGITLCVGSLAGMLDGLGVMFIYLAYHANGKASQVSPIGSTLQQLFTVVLAIVFLKERLALAGIIGIGLAVSGSWFLSIVNKKELR